jgi:hypothetical protein
LRFEVFAGTTVMAGPFVRQGDMFQMDARNVRIGETGMDQLIQWLRQTGTPQNLDTLTERYLAILRELVGVEEER